MVNIAPFPQALNFGSKLCVLYNRFTCSTQVLTVQAPSSLTWILDFQIWIAHVSIDNRRYCSQVSEWFICLPFLDVALVV